MQYDIFISEPGEDLLYFMQVFDSVSLFDVEFALFFCCISVEYRLPCVRFLGSLNKIIWLELTYLERC